MENNRQKQLLTTASCCFQLNFYVKYEIINNTPSQVSPVRVVARHSAQSRHVEADSVQHIRMMSLDSHLHTNINNDMYELISLACIHDAVNETGYYATYKLSQANQANPIPFHPKHFDSTKR